MGFARMFVATTMILASVVSARAAGKEVVKAEVVKEIKNLNRLSGGYSAIVCIDGYKFVYSYENPAAAAPGVALVQFFERVKDKQGNEKMLPATCK